MKKALQIVMEYPDLAQAEIEAIAGKSQRFDNLVIINTSKQLDRLAFTKRISDVIAITTKTNLNKDISKINWNKIITKDYCVRSNKKVLEPKLGSLIWKQLQKPKVNLENPKTKIVFIYHKNKIFILKQIKKLNHTFEQRKAHRREALLPIAMHPRLACAMVNLLYPAKTIYDPFCGTGGILIEAGLMGINTIGSDIDKRMINATKTNLKKYKIKAKLKQADATKIKAKHIVAELPFGKNTKKQDLIKLYTAFLKNCKKNKSKLVVSFPNTINFKQIIKKTKYKIKSQFKIPIHKSLTKTIVILEP